ncbi:MAG TPA: hypothetical protein G4O18_07565 [Dehalococcoidia bacterium]|nr:hypothetical protein [Dehalococcoidia bacterium]
MELEQLVDKSLALVVWGENKQGKDEVVVYAGTMKVEDGSLFFHRDDESVHFGIPLDDLNRIKPVPSELSEMLLKCEYFVNINIQPIPEDADPEDYRQTGLKWPE